MAAADDGRSRTHRRRGRAGLHSAAVAVPVAVALAACGASTSGGTAPVASTSPGSGSSAAASGAASLAPTPHQTESNPVGDIPDQQVYVAYTPPGGQVSVKVPEGWARSQRGDEVTFTDKLNSISILVHPAATAPTPAAVSAAVVPQLRGQVPAFAMGQISTVTRAAGPGVLVTYLGDSPPDPVTGKVVRDAYERYSFWRAGTEVVLTLSGPQAADNVDPWKIVSGSVRWQ